MTSAVHQFRPVIALFCTRGMEAFLSNALHGILQVGIAADQIVVGCPDTAIGCVRNVVTAHSSGIQVISMPELSEVAETESYFSFGTRQFTEISWTKIFLIKRLLELHAHVLYADLDVAWLRNPLPYLAEVASAYPMAFQTEGLPRFPPALCSGFAFFAKSERALTFLAKVIAIHDSDRGQENRLDDQPAIQQLIEDDPTWLRDIYCLPEALFPNGLGDRKLTNAGDTHCRMEGELLPFVFHANWTVVLDNKHKLLANTGTWRVSEQIGRGEPDQETAHDAT